MCYNDVLLFYVKFTMNIEYYEICGVLGAVVVLIAYFLLSAKKINANTSLYYSLNILGSVLLIFSLLYDWNLASFFIEVSWLLISVYGLTKVAIVKNKLQTDERKDF